MDPSYVGELSSIVDTVKWEKSSGMDRDRTENSVSFARVDCSFHRSTIDGSTKVDRVTLSFAMDPWLRPRFKFNGR